MPVGRQFIRILLGIAATLAVIYISDLFGAHFHPLGSVQVQPYYAIHLKNKKVEFDFSPPAETDYCVTSMLPHFGYPPCWYLKRNTTKRIDE
jgi:hypothetical protein